MEHKRFVAPIIKAETGEDGTFSGYASVFGVEDLDGDIIMRGAFSKCLGRCMEKGRMPKMLWQHEPSHIIGKWTKMVEDENGLYVEGQLINGIQKAEEAYALMKAGELEAMSVGFNIIDAGPNGTHGRVINELDLWETSLVTWGANPKALITHVKARSSIRDFELFLRDSGFSHKEAVAIASKGFRAIQGQRDSAEDGEDTALIEALKSLSKTTQYEVHRND